MIALASIALLAATLLLRLGPRQLRGNVGAPPAAPDAAPDAAPEASAGRAAHPSSETPPV